ncbi:MAG: ROK family transcriptional regulator [Sporichthyaceae bacterium]
MAPTAGRSSVPPPEPARPARLRSLNDATALRLLLAHGALSRVDMVRLTGISKPTASQLLARLEGAGLVRAVGRSTGGPGRSAVLFELDPASGHAAALDVTPHRIHAQVADITGKIVGEHVLRRPPRTAGSGPANALLALYPALAEARLHRRRLSSIVIAATGSYDVVGDRLRYARDLPGWSDERLVTTLQRATRVPVFIENDVNLAAVAERRVGAAQEISDFFLFWVGDGIGGALLLDDRLRRGATGGAGEIAFLQPSGAETVHRPQRSGAGAMELWAGGAALADLARENGLHGREAVALVTAAVAAGDDGAGFLDGLARRYAQGLSSVIAVLDPGAIVLAGPVLAAGGEPLRALIGHHLSTMAITSPPFIRGTVSGNPVLVGAMCTALDHARAAVFGAA